MSSLPTPYIFLLPFNILILSLKKISECVFRNFVVQIKAKKTSKNAFRSLFSIAKLENKRLKKRYVRGGKIIYFFVPSDHLLYNPSIVEKKKI
jgi:hypothetical protein